MRTMSELKQLIGVQENHLKTAIHLEDFSWEVEIENNLENLRIEFDQVQQSYAVLSLDESECDCE